MVCDLKSVLVCINFMHHDGSMARGDKAPRQYSTYTYDTYQLPYTRKSKDVGIVGAEISLINSVLVRIKCLKSVDIVEDASS